MSSFHPLILRPALLLLFAVQSLAHSPSFDCQTGPGVDPTTRSECPEILDDNREGPPNREYFSIATLENHLYLGGGNGGTVVFGLSNPDQPQLLTAIGNDVIYELHYQPEEHRVLAAGNSALLIYDVSTPANPVLLGSLAGQGQAMTAEGNLVYTLSETTGFRVLDVSNPALPLLLGQCSTPGVHWELEGRELVKSGDYVYAALGGGLVLDVSDPSQPQLAAALDFSIHCRGLAIRGDQCLLAAGNTMKVMDISNPLNPQVQSVIEFATPSGNVCYDADTAIVALSQFGLARILITDPWNPQLLDLLGFPDATGSHMSAMAIRGANAHLAGWSWDGVLESPRLITARILCGAPAPFPDCNGNEIPDAEEIADGLAEDCNGNGIPDECDLADAVSQDCNGNGIPDECETGTAYFELRSPVANLLPSSAVTLVDLDRDGNLDLVATGPDEALNWLRNDGNPQPQFVTHWLLDPEGAIGTLATTDLDRDRDPDIVFSLPALGKLIWLENDGAATPQFLAHLLAEGLPGLREFRSSDIDRDGFPDLCALVPGTDQLVWLQHDGAPQPGFIPHTISTTTVGANCLAMGDVNNDGAPDILAGVAGTAGLDVWLNDGFPLPGFSRQLISAGVGGITSIEAADLDGDGDTDLMYGPTLDMGFAWLESSGGVTPVFSEHVLTVGDSFQSPNHRILPRDLDGDHDLDLLISAPEVYINDWLENQGGTFILRELDYSPGYSTASLMLPGDLDRDGDLDLVVPGVEPLGAVWLQQVDPDCNGNRIPDSCEIVDADCNLNGVPDVCEIASGMSADLDGNGVPDDCETDCNANGWPDDWEIREGLVPDCNGNLIPDGCDLADLTSPDCNANGVPDECDIDLGASTDLNTNDIPDDCEAVNLDRQLVYSTLQEALADARATERLLAPPLLFTQEPQVSFVSPATRLRIAGDVIQDPGGLLLLEEGVQLLADDDILLSGELRTRIGNDVDLIGHALRIETQGRLHGAAESVLDLRLGSSLTSNGTLELDLQALLAAGDTVRLGGSTVLNAAGLVAGELSNTGALQLRGGTLLLDHLENAGSLSGWGEMLADVENSGEILVLSDLLIGGDVLNEGQIQVQNGGLTILGDLSGSGTVTGQFLANPAVHSPGCLDDVPARTCRPSPLASRLHTLRQSADRSPERGADLSEARLTAEREGPAGVVVLGDLRVQPGAALLLEGTQALLKVGGDVDIALSDPTRFALNGGTLQLVGLAEEIQTLEVLSTDIGEDPLGLQPGTPGQYPLGSLILGPGGSTVRLVDNHDNDGAGQDQMETLYLHRLEIGSGSHLQTQGAHIYAEEILIAGSVDHPEDLRLLSLDAPANLRIRQLQPMVWLLEWDAVQGADGYRLYSRGPTDSLFQHLGDTSATTFVLTQPLTSPGQAWVFRVTAIRGGTTLRSGTATPSDRESQDVERPRQR
ncbi:MAG: VCBS repeat-containing protein [Candidatus Cloacimonetes bacterium]|nr:VCBS repeat-containing protein [Candidatus Cloacimonadota bacterium]